MYDLGPDEMIMETPFAVTKRANTEHSTERRIDDTGIKPTGRVVPLG